ncbi:MAG: sulfotransferase [Myxococcota bacterium]
MPVAFVIGAPRSGTTLLRVMLAGHPQLFSPPEMVIAPFATMQERKARLAERFWEKGGLRRALMELDGLDVEAAKVREATFDDKTVPEVYQYLFDRLHNDDGSERILVDKCPHLVATPEALTRLAKWYPDARWIWIIRHPGSVTRSVENMPMAEVMLQGYAPEARDIWHHANRNLQRFLAGVADDRKVLVRYEELVADARPVLERVCATLGVPFHEAVLDPYEGDRMREGPPGARAVGDPNMAGRGKIDPTLATKWLGGFDPASVSPETHTLARDLGYDLGALPPPPIAQATMAMNALFDTARELEAKIKVPADLDAVEGRRFLLRMVAASIDLFVEEGDVEAPHFHHSEGPTRKVFADNPDADYLRAPIRLGRDSSGAARVYRVWGTVPPGTQYVGMLLYKRGGMVGNRLQDFAFVQPGGTFDVRISSDDAPEGEAGVWLKGDGDETAVMIRQYYTDRATQPPVTLHVERLGAAAPGPLTAQELAKGLERARRNLTTVFERTLQGYTFASQMALNRFVALDGEQFFPTPDNKYLLCWYRFGEDQVMFVRGRLPKARYFSFTLYNAWMESLDYTRPALGRVSLNHAQIETDEHGNFELCLAHENPGHPNWIATTGHAAGYLLARSLLPEEALPVPTIEVRYLREWKGSRS